MEKFYNMVRNEKELKQAMTQLVQELHNPIVSNTAMNERQVIAKAVQLGMDYKEFLIRAGIEIVFKETKK